MADYKRTPRHETVQDAVLARPEDFPNVAALDDLMDRVRGILRHRGAHARLAVDVLPQYGMPLEADTLAARVHAALVEDLRQVTR